jgi:hypothetical protein
VMARLEIFVSAHCFGCEEARRLAKAVADRFQAVAVRVVDLDIEPETRPEHVIGVPAYLLDDTVIALGSPRQGELFQQIEQAMSTERVSRR